MNKDAKAMKYAIEPIRKILHSEAVSDGGTQKKADALRGTWIRLNDSIFAFVEEAQTTLVYNDEEECGCACNRFADNSMDVLCEHIIALNNLPNPPQLPIESKECRWLQEYLFSCGWYAENRYLYPSLDAGTIEQEVVKELPPVGEELDPVNEDKPLDTGVDNGPEPKMYSRKCTYCGNTIHGADLAQVKLDTAEHIKECPKNPANREKAPEPTDAKNTTAEKPLKKEGKKVKPNTAVAKQEPRTPAVKKEMPTEAQFQTAAVGRLMKNQGSIYKVSGKEVADSAAISNYAVSAGVSTETTVLEQTVEYARATVRAYKHGRYTEGSVLIRKDAILEKLMIDLAEKNPKWIIGWSNGLPEFDLDQKVYIGDKQKILGLHIAGTLIDAWTFAARNCETKARRRAQIQMLGADWREDDEVESEVEEMNTVAKR